MKTKWSIVRTTVVALATAASLSPAFGEAAKGGLYVLHTPASGTCPTLDWHIVVEPNGSLTGFAAWDDMKHMARLNGAIGKNGAFKMNGQEVGGEDRKAVVTGTASGYYIKIAINGSGTGCDNKIFEVPRFAGGLAGGGG